MNHPFSALRVAPYTLPLATALAVFSIPQLSSAQSTLLDGMIAYWPLEVIEGGRTPDLTNGYSMTTRNMDEENIVPGMFGNAFSFNAADEEILHRLNIIEGENREELPLEQHENFSISMWVRGDGMNQNGGNTDPGDRRIFSEGSTLTNTILFTLGTQVDDGLGSDLVLLYRNNDNRTTRRTADLPVFDDEWHHIALIQTGAEVEVFIDNIRVLSQLNNNRRPLGPETNTTAIGGIFRSDFTHHFNGLIDEVALWNRAITEEEVATLSVEAPPTPVEILPLNLRSFSPDRTTTASGRPIVLRWEGSPDATYLLNPGAIDLTSLTVAGAGQTTVMPTEETTYTLTATRGGESLSLDTTVQTLDGVAPGWALLDDFESFEPGQVSNVAAPFWLNPEIMQRWRILDIEGNSIATSIPGDGVIVTQLQSYEIADGETRTLFFHGYVEPGIDGIRMRSGITNSSLRGFPAETNGNLGAYLTIVRPGAAPDVNLETLDFTGAGVIPAGVWGAYWLEITNSMLDETDTLSVYYQASDATERTLLIENSIGDRGNADPLRTFFMAGKFGNTRENGFFLDNVFISENTEALASLPVAFPPQPPEVVFLDPLEVTSVTFDGTTVVLNWNGDAGQNYTVERSFNLEDWDILTTVATGNTFTEDPMRAETTIFYRVSGPNPF